MTPQDYIAEQADQKWQLSQRARILQLLLDARGEEVSLPDILALNIAQYSARIFELRRAGFNTINRGQWVDGALHTWFRLELQSPRAFNAPAPAQPAQPQAAEVGPPGSLFGDISPESRYPD